MSLSDTNKRVPPHNYRRFVLKPLLVYFLDRPHTCRHPGLMESSLQVNMVETRQDRFARLKVCHLQIGPIQLFGSFDLH